MVQCFVAFAISAVLTSIFAFRFQTWRRPKVLLSYFVLFFVAELVCERLWLPPDALDVEVGIVCLVLAVIFVGVTWIGHRLGGLEQREE